MRRALLVLLAWVLAAVCAAPAAAATTAPSNDAIADATRAYLGFEQILDTTGATSVPAEELLFIEGCGMDGWERSVWYRVVPRRDTVVHVDTRASDYFAVMAVATGPLDDLGIHACGSDVVDFPVEAGQAYYVGVVDYDLVGGTFLRIAFSQGLPQPTVGVSTWGRARVWSGGAVRLGGTYTCTHARRVVIWTTVRQGESQSSKATTVWRAQCDGRPHPWSTTFSADTGTFVPGPAWLDVPHYIACSTWCSSDVSLPTARVLLRWG